ALPGPAGDRPPLCGHRLPGVDDRHTAARRGPAGFGLADHDRDTGHRVVCDGRLGSGDGSQVEWTRDSFELSVKSIPPTVTERALIPEGIDNQRDWRLTLGSDGHLT